MNDDRQAKINKRALFLSLGIIPGLALTYVAAFVCWAGSWVGACVTPPVPLLLFSFGLPFVAIAYLKLETIRKHLILFSVLYAVCILLLSWIVLQENVFFALLRGVNYIAGPFYKLAL